MLPFTRARNLTSRRRLPTRICKNPNIFRDGTHGVSPGTDGSNPSPSSGESANFRSLARCRDRIPNAG